MSSMLGRAISRIRRVNSAAAEKLELGRFEPRQPDAGEIIAAGKLLDDMDVKAAILKWEKGLPMSEVEEVELVIDEALMEMIGLPRMDEEKFARLKEDIVRDGGVSDPIIVWAERGVIIDGRHRYTAWDELPDDAGIDPPEIVEMTFGSEEEVIQWARRRALNQRNLDSKQEALIIAEIYEQEKKATRGRPRKGSGPDGAPKPPSDESEPTSTSGNVSGSARSRVAQQVGVSESTVAESDRYARALKAISEIDTKLGRDLRVGHLDASKEDVITMAKLAPESLQKAGVNLRAGRKFNEGPPPKSPGEKGAPSSGDENETLLPWTKKDDKKLESAIGVVTRMLTDRSKRTSSERKRPVAATRKALEAFHEEWLELQTKVPAEAS